MAEAKEVKVVIPDEPEQPEIKATPVVRKNMLFLRRKPSIKQLLDERRGRLTDLSGNHTVEIDWGLNLKAKRDGVFKLKIDDKEVFLDLDELMFHTRVMFM